MKSTTSITTLREFFYRRLELNVKFNNLLIGRAVVLLQKRTRTAFFDIVFIENIGKLFEY